MKYSKYLSKNSLLQLLFVILMPTVTVAQSNTVSEFTLELVKNFEGWSAAAYDDPVGYCTIGYGHLIAKESCNEIDLEEFSQAITFERGEELLQLRINEAQRAVESLVTTQLNEDQYGALVSFTFNVGAENFRKSTLLFLLNTGDLQLAAREFPRWVLAKQQIQPGLVTRRRCEAALFTGNLITTNSFNRQSCELLGISPSASTLIDIYEGE